VDLLERHNTVVRTSLGRFRGREVGTMGDGFLATFDGPVRAIRCAQSIVTAVASLGLEVRAGLHTGEVEVVGDDVAGLAVHIGARCGAGWAGRVLVSRTVRTCGRVGTEFVSRASRARDTGRWEGLRSQGTDTVSVSPRSITNPTASNPPRGGRDDELHGLALCRCLAIGIVLIIAGIVYRLGAGCRGVSSCWESSGRTGTSSIPSDRNNCGPSPRVDYERILPTDRLRRLPHKGGAIIPDGEREIRVPCTPRRAVHSSREPFS
jgi:hypothetical protein